MPSKSKINSPSSRAGDTYDPSRPFQTLRALTSLGRSRSSWYLDAAEGRINLRKMGGQVVVLTSDLDRFLEDLPVLKVKA